MKPARYILIFIAAAICCCCIDRHLPAPEIEGEILEFEVEGQTGSTVNEALRTVTVGLDESVDIRRVRVSKLSLVEGGSCGEIDPGMVIDLSGPKKVLVRTLADYEWTISATQNIRYDFEIEGLVGDQPVVQVGESRFELHSHSVFAYVPIGTDMRKIKIRALKLWPEGTNAAIDPVVGENDVVSFRRSSETDRDYIRTVKVGYSYEDGRNVEQEWNIYVTETDTQLDFVNPFTYRVQLSAFGQNGLDNGFEYRPAEGYDPAAAEEVSGWTRVPESMTGKSDRGIFTATLTGLEKETQYAVRAFSGESVSEVEYFTTMAEGTPLPGGGFEEWNQTQGVWYPWPAGGIWEENRWWDTGNKGVAMIKPGDGGNTLPTESGTGSPANPGGKAAKLQTVWAAIKAAGGNIYFGEFGKMTGFDATCHLGHTWRDKPTKLTGRYKYFPQKVDDLGESVAPYWKFHPYGYPREQWLGSTDSLHVCVALWASPDGRDIPFTVNTDPKDNGRNFLDFSRDVDGVIAYGAFVSGEEQSEWDGFTVELEYYTAKQMSGVTRDYLADYLATGNLPANTQLYLLITASKNCNYFIAGTGKGGSGGGSLMYVDEVELVYD